MRLSSVMVRAADLQSTGYEFDSGLLAVHCWVMNLGVLFTLCSSVNQTGILRSILYQHILKFTFVGPL